MEDYEWVLVKQPTDRDVWNPSPVNSEEGLRPLEVRFNDPAKYWTDAVPIGNGRLGAMIWGGVSNEILNLNGKQTFHLCLYSVFFCGHKILPEK